MKTHLQSNTRLYKIWAGIKKRCTNSRAENFYLYGGRGIKMCAEWNEFMPFYLWASTAGYNDSLIIDREDVNGNYEPENCKWVTLIESANNKRTSLFIDFEGKKMTLAQILALKNLSHKYNVVHNRVAKLGWNIYDALTDKPYSRYKNNAVAAN